jgi:D-alanyl-D-alanine carboxypeptidase/D-alanyl-D-alanine-endopeptidase (penicillin-binding protein 4)
MPRSLYRRNPLWELENVTVLKKCAEWDSVRSWLAIVRTTGAKALLLITAILVEASVVTPTLQAQESAAFAKQVQQFIDQEKWESALWGIHIISLKDGRVLFSSNARKRFLPASSMKLLIGAAALDTVSPDFRFETSVYGEGAIDAHGRLLGNLVIAGHGDPNLESRIYDPQFEELTPQDVPASMAQTAMQLADRGVKSIVGDVIADETLFLHEPHDPSWALENMLWSYCAPVSSLAVSENWFQLEVLPAESEGGAAFIRPVPPETGFVFVNQVKTVGHTRQPWIGIDRNEVGNRITVRGEIPLRHAGLKYNLAALDGGVFAAQLMRLALAQRGIGVTGNVKTRQLAQLDILEQGKTSTDAAKRLQSIHREEQRLASIKTQPLSESLKIMMKASNNLYAEIMLRNLGAWTTGLGSVNTGTAAVEAFLEKTGTPKNGVSLNDGSGLSRKNLITPESVVRVLQYMDLHPRRDVFLELLPVAGRDGTLRNRMKKGPAFEHIFAKTGSIEFVNALSGFAIAKNGERLAFSIMVNNAATTGREVREAIDMICEWMTQ